MVDVGALEALIDDSVAALMITNPNTVGVFEENIAQICADGLATRYENVRVRMPDTFAQRFDPGTNASRSTISVGNAVLQAATQVHAELSLAAEDVLGASDGLRLEGGDVVVGDRRMPLVELMAKARGLAPHWLGSMSAVGAHDSTKGDGPLGYSSSFYEVGHAAAEVAVDRDTGESGSSTTPPSPMSGSGSAPPAVRDRMRERR